MINLLLSILLWFIKFVPLFFINVFTMIFAPVICLFVTKAEENSITGKPSMFPGKPREFLIKPLRWFQTTDAPLDEFWYGDYAGWPKTGKTQADYDSSWYLRYRCRVAWVWRNPAYGFGTAWGFVDKDIVIATVLDNEKDWNSGKNVHSYWVFVNSDGATGWCFRMQYYYYSSRCLEVFIGYKIMGDTIRGKKLVAMQITPFPIHPLKQT